MRTSSKTPQSHNGNDSLYVYNAKQIKLVERLRLIVAGRRDARAGLLTQDEEGVNSSPTISLLRAEAQKSVSTNLNATSREIGRVQARLDILTSDYENLIARLKGLDARIKEAVASASRPRPEDANSSPSTQSSRQARRVGDATGELKSEYDRLAQEVCEIAVKASALEDAHSECLYLMNERLAITVASYQARCYIYLRAAKVPGVGERSIPPLVMDAVNASRNAFLDRTKTYDFTRHLVYLEPAKS